MRIIAGELGGRRIEAPDWDGTRPMLDRVREACFGTLGDLIEDAAVLDLYAGSGSLGLEALSRGARSARFVEKHPVAFTALKANIEALQVGDRARYVRGNALDPASWGAVSAADAPAEAAQRFELVFFDPPYKLLADPKARTELFATVDTLVSGWMNTPGALVFHLPQASVGTLRLASGRKPEVRTYGTSALCYLWTRAS